MTKPLSPAVSSVLHGFSTPEGEKRLQIASLWEETSRPVSRETQILKLENNLLFVKIKDPMVAQELKLRVQRAFLEKYEKEFGEKLKDIRFLVGD